MARRKANRDEKLREEIGIYENLMEDVEVLTNIFIGNETIEDFTEGGDYEPLLRLISEFHFSPENKRIYTALISRIKNVEKKVYDLRQNIQANHKKAQYIYKNA